MQEIMNVYVNHQSYGLMIPADVLIAIRKPKYIELLHNDEKNCIVIRGLLSATDNSFTVPSSTYEGNLLVLPGGQELTKKARIELGWGNALQAVECSIVKESADKSVALVNLNKAQPSESLLGPFIMPEEFNDDDDYTEDDSDEEDDV